MLKIIAQTPVAKHLKKRRVTIVADIVNILRAQTRLTIGNPRAARVRLAKQERNHWLHTRAGKQRRRVVVQDKRCTLHDRVAALLIKLQILFANFLGIHRGNYTTEWHIH